MWVAGGSGHDGEEVVVVGGDDVEGVELAVEGVLEGGEGDEGPGVGVVERHG